MNFKNLSQAQFSKLRNGINGVGEFRYDTICSQNFVSIGLLVWKLLGGTKILHRHTHRHTHTHTHRHTPRHTHTPAAHFMSLFFQKETRLKIEVYKQNTTVQSSTPLKEQMLCSGRIPMLEINIFKINKTSSASLTNEP